jgi:hypothetical protein
MHLTHTHTHYTSNSHQLVEIICVTAFTHVLQNYTTQLSNTLQAAFAQAHYTAPRASRAHLCCHSNAAVIVHEASQVCLQGLFFTAALPLLCIVTAQKRRGTGIQVLPGQHTDTGARWGGLEVGAEAGINWCMYE